MYNNRLVDLCLIYLIFQDVDTLKCQWPIQADIEIYINARSHLSYYFLIEQYT